MQQQTLLANAEAVLCSCQQLACLLWHADVQKTAMFHSNLTFAAVLLQLQASTMKRLR
jgi:hypothetical protein